MLIYRQEGEKVILPLLPMKSSFRTSRCARASALAGLCLAMLVAILPAGTVAGAAAVTTVGATNITETGATLGGMVTGLAEDAKATLYFEYGLTGAYGQQANAATRTARGTFSANVSGLQAGTTYHFRAVANLGDGIAYGFDTTFLTGGAPSQTAPVVSTDIQATTLMARGVDADRATLAGEIKFLGERQRPIKVWFEWGDTTGYGQSTPVSSRSAEGELTVPLTGLAAGVTYHYRLRVDSGAGGVAHGSDISFATPRVLPEVFTLAATQVSDNISRFNGSLGSLGRTSSAILSFEYGQTSEYGSRTPAQSLSAPGAFSTQVAGLTAGTTWHLRARADTDTGGVAYGADVFYTPGRAYILTVMVNGSGAVIPAAGPHTYSPGTVIDLDATASPDWKFEGWSGDVSDNASALKLVMSGSRTVTATFSTTKRPEAMLAYTVDSERGALFYTIKADGSGKQRLPLAEGPYLEPALSPDNTLIAYASGGEDGSQLAIMNANSSSPRLLTRGSGGDARTPAWSPDGKAIAFAWEDTAQSQIYLVGAEGGEIRRLTTSNGYEIGPAWSPDGKRLAFASDRDSESMEIWVMDADGKNPARLTNSPDAYDCHPTWSPDGSQLAWQASGKEGSFIWTMQADGKNTRKLTAGGEPAWMADGRIIFTLRDGARDAFWAINPDGSGLNRLAVK